MRNMMIDKYYKRYRLLLQILFTYSLAKFSTIRDLSSLLLLTLYLYSLNGWVIYEKSSKIFHQNYTNHALSISKVHDIIFTQQSCQCEEGEGDQGEGEFLAVANIYKNDLQKGSAWCGSCGRFQKLPQLWRARLWVRRSFASSWKIVNGSTLV